MQAENSSRRDSSLAGLLSGPEFDLLGPSAMSSFRGLTNLIAEIYSPFIILTEGNINQVK
jgi:hypothetical protein